MNALSLDRRQLFISAAAAALVKAISARAHNGTVHVTIENMAFQPETIEVRAGETIEWVNKDRVPHTATVRDKWEVLIAPGKAGTKLVGTGDDGDYLCRFHPNMTGKIVIVG